MRLQTRQNLIRLSRDRSFLLRSSLLIMSVACVIAWLVSTVTSKQGAKALIHSANGDSEEFGKLISQTRQLDAEQTAYWIRNAGRLMIKLVENQRPELPLDDLKDKVQDVDALLTPQSPLLMLEKLIADAEKVNSSERMLLLNLTRGLYADKKTADQALENLNQAAQMDPAVRFANEFYADVLIHSRVDSGIEALSHYLTESLIFKQSDYARHQAVKMMILSKDEKRLIDIRDDPGFTKNLTAHDRIDIAVILRDWLGLAKAVIQLDYQRSSISRYLISFIAGGIWLIIIGQFGGFSRRQITLYLSAVLLGIFSASTTLFVVIIDSDVRGFSLEGDLLHQLIFCVSGIGLREESIKLLFFIPLIPFLRKRPEIEALIAAAFVGLGFAIQENVGYYLGEDFSPWPRFVTANFLHLSLTGILGLSLVNFIRWPRTRWEELVATFIGVVFAHGLYDAFIMVPELSNEYSIFSLLIFWAIAYRFFDQIEHLAKSGRNQTVSPLGIFILGAALLGSVVMIFSCWQIPFQIALIGFLASGLQIVPLMFIFINRFRDA